MRESWVANPDRCVTVVDRLTVHHVIHQDQDNSCEIYVTLKLHFIRENLATIVLFFFQYICTCYNVLNNKLNAIILPHFDNILLL